VIGFGSSWSSICSTLSGVRSRSVSISIGSPPAVADASGAPRVTSGRSLVV
jgi:hypothetical protein